MKDGLTWLVFVVDRSGSMGSIAGDMIGGYNEFIKKQRAVPGTCKVFFYQFDDIYESVLENVDIQDVKDLTSDTYVPRGSTALYDALGRTIDDIGKKLAAMDEAERPEKVLVITITDGYENASHVYTLSVIRDMIKHQTETYKWDFAYIGANQDSWAVGSAMGYSSGTTSNYTADSVGVRGLFNSLGDSAAVYRMSAKAKFKFVNPTTPPPKP